ncbi:MAG: ATP-binding cassette domain-containing protein, partial [Alphaproteobacteria bacterium]|nr:ATP-binding cassette domain-containing protein [Alphaproteobacteria bacterium]
MSTDAAVANAVHVRPAEPLVEALRHGRLGDFEATSPYAACLMPLLTRLGWRGDPGRIVEALPHVARNLDLEGLRNVLVELSYLTRPIKGRIADIDPRLLPCLHVDEAGRPRAVLEVHDGRYGVFDGALAREVQTRGETINGTIYLIEVPDGASEAPGQESFMTRLAARFRPLIWRLGLVVLMADVLALAFPLFTMAIYDKVIGHGERGLLLHLLIGMGLALAMDLVLRNLRAGMVARLGARIERLVGVAVLGQILKLPIAYTESAPIGSQLARLKDFESLREFFTGPLSAATLDIPFLVIFLAALAIIGGWLVFVPMALAVLFVALAFALSGVQRELAARSSRSRARRHALVVEIVSKMRSIKQIGGADVWRERFRGLSAASANDGFKAQQLTGLLNTLGQTLMMAAGAVVLILGATRILEGDMTVGALVASMALTWRILAPLQMGLMTLWRIEQVRSSIKQIDHLMRLKTEPQERPTSTVAERFFTGRLALNRVSLRYRPDSEPALLGVDLVIRPGEMVGLVGPSGAGKSTLLKVLAGLYQPQAGTVMIDGLDIRQIVPGELRKAVTYCPQNRHLFYGTVAQNLRLAEPGAGEDALRAALAEADALEDVLALPGGLDTALGEDSSNPIPAGLLQRIALARAYLRPSPVLLMDEPGQWLDERADAALIAALRRRKGRQTIVLVT